MICFPNAKINIGLTIKGKRADGFHDLETIFYPVGLKDVLEILECPGVNNEFQLTCLGNPIQGDITENLCYKAYFLLKKDFPQLPPIQCLLYKNIPTGAGLGGGSADGAFMIRLLNDKFNLQIPTSRLIEYAAVLGSDCPFFIINTPCIAEGRGEILHPVELNLSGYSILLIHPGIHIHTGTAFKGVKIATHSINLRTAIQMPIETWKDQIINDFEVGIFEKHPPIKEIKLKLYQEGAIYASMSGTGSAVFGIFPQKKEIIFPNNYLIKWL